MGRLTGKGRDRLKLGVEVRVGQELILVDPGQLHVYGLSVVVERGRLREDGERADDRSDGEDPKKESVQDHRDKTPVLILLQGSEFWNQNFKKMSCLHSLIKLLEKSYVKDQSKFFDKLDLNKFDCNH